MWGSLLRGTVRTSCCRHRQAARLQNLRGNYYLKREHDGSQGAGLCRICTFRLISGTAATTLSSASILDRLNYNAQFLRQPISFLQPGQPPAGQPPMPCPTDANGVPVPAYYVRPVFGFSGGNYTRFSIPKPAPMPRIAGWSLIGCSSSRACVSTGMKLCVRVCSLRVWGELTSSTMREIRNSPRGSA